MQKSKTSLAVFLFCENKTTSIDWSAVACPTFKLVPFDSSKNAIELRPGYYVFDKTSLSFGFPTFIAWNKLMDVHNSYVENDTINMEIKIEVADPKERDTSILKCDKIETSCTEDCVTNYRFNSDQHQISFGCPITGNLTAKIALVLHYS